MNNPDDRPPGGLTASFADPASITGDGPAAGPLAASPAPSKRYALDEEIAHGGMGVIYRATDISAAHNNLGLALGDKKDLDGAIAEYREAIRLSPKFPVTHITLGLALQDKGDLDGAIAAYQESLRLDPKHSYALTKLPRAQRMRELLSRLPDVLAGKDKPKSPAEGIAFADLCAQQFQKRYADAARLYADAFAADPKLADDWQASHTYYAAVCAVRAAQGDGVDAPADLAGRSALRAKALGWLRGFLALRRRQANSAKPADRQEAGRALLYWQADADLAGVREAEPLAKLPTAEREDWQKFWAEVKATLADAKKPAPPPKTDAGKK